MPYKDCVLQTEPLSIRESETTMAQAILLNQSPVMKMWFLVMVLNLGLFLFLMH